MRVSKASAFFIMLCFSAALLFVCPSNAQAESTPPKRFIAIVYDDSGSMRYNDQNRDVYKSYIYANYSLQNLVALMESRDTANIYLISKKGRNAKTVTGQQNLYNELKNVGANPKGDTYAETINMAFQDGAAFMASNKNSEFLFVMITDGNTMYDDKGKEIKGSLVGLFNDYIKQNELGAYSGSTRALLLSIGNSVPLTPVSELEACMKQAGVFTQVFVADVSMETTAGENIMASMTDLAESMASTKMMQIEPEKPFTIRYPLESLVIMEQFQQSSESMVKSIAGSGGTLTRDTLYKTKAIKGVKLASTFSSIKSASGPVMPGQYTLSSSGQVKVMAFSKVGFTTNIVITDYEGKKAAEFIGNRWNVDGISLKPGEKLKGEARFVALDGAVMDMDLHVSMDFGMPEGLSCKKTGQGEFEIQGVKAGHEHMTISLADPDFFQINIPTLNVEIMDAPQPTASPSTGSATVDATLPATTGSAGQPSYPSAFGWEDVADLSATTTEVEYTSSIEYKKATEYTLNSIQESKIKAHIASALPLGLQVRFNDTVFDAHNNAGTLDVKEANSLSVWVNSTFSATGNQTFQLQLESGEALDINVISKPRRIKIETSPNRLEFGVLEGRQSIPACIWKVSIMENGTWSEMKASELPIFTILQPVGLGWSRDDKTQSVVLFSSWLPVLTPIGSSSVTLHAGTGKPGEVVDASIDVFVRDDWRKWLYFFIGVLITAVIAAYTIAIIFKKRIPLGMKAFVSENPNMSESIGIEPVRDMVKRNFWPFGKETCTLGPLELYPHPKRAKLVILSSVCVQYGLRLDGKPPQFHKAKDNAGDFIIGESNIIGIRMNNEYRYYKIVFSEKTTRKPGRPVSNK